MLKIKEVTLKNFYSTGMVPQKVTIRDMSTTLIMGDNVDYGDGESGTIRNGVGKAQPLNAKVKTPSGWKTIGTLKVGDIVSTPEGSTAVVVGKFPQGKKKIFEIKTADGKKTRACREHLWELASGEVVNTETIYTRLKNKESVQLPMSVSDGENVKPSPLDPYVIGLLLGCGIVELDEDGKEWFIINTYENDIIRKVLDNNPYTIHHSGLRLSEEDNELAKQLFSFKNDDIAPIVAFDDFPNSVRKIILTGVFDSSVDIEVVDGYYGYLHSYNDNLACSKAIRDLVWSMGGLCKRKVKFNANVSSGSSSIQDREYSTLDIYIDNASEYFSFDKLEFNRIKNTNIVNEIVSIRTVGIEEACCIKISSGRELYITDDYIPTHNTTMINAISYALFGDTITKPRKKAAIINYINGKELLVTLRFEVDGVDYYIERGQKPNVMKFVKINSNGEEEPLAQGSNSSTDQVIEETIGMSHLLCKYIMLMSTYAEPFMNEDAAKQRSIIEELLGIGELSLKAEAIKEKEKYYSIELEKEQVRIKTIIEANSRVERAVTDLKAKSDSWVVRNRNDIQEVDEAIAKLTNIDIDAEIELHKENARINEVNTLYKTLENELRRLVSSIASNEATMVKLSKKIEQVQHLGTCHACNQTLGADEAAKQEASILSEISSIMSTYDNDVKMRDALIDELAKITPSQLNKTYYATLEKAQGHERSLSLLRVERDNLVNMVNPYLEQITSLQNTDYGVQEVDYSKIEEYESILKHYKYLKKLLTHKDSFLRKVIINRSLPFLNKQLRYYLDILSLPHHVVFDADLTFNITHMGVDSDYSILSRGEQNRVTYALNLAFRDLFESTRRPINVLFVDELLDFGVDSTGAIAGLQILKNIAYTGRSTFLVTHKEELVERVGNIIYVKKENGFTTYEEQKN